MAADLESKQEQRRPAATCCMKTFPATPSPKPEMEKEVACVHVEVGDDFDDQHQKKPGGWKSMPFIIGNETFERLAVFGLLANFMVYLKREYHMEQVVATNFINVFSGVSNFAPLLGAYISDAYIGRFWAIAIGSVASLLGMVTLTLTAWIPTLRPTPCQLNNPNNSQAFQQLGSCAKPSGPQLGFLTLALGLQCIGTAGVRPCSLPFGLDQFDHNTEEGRRGINSYYNWYYTTFTVVVMITLTIMVYIQDSVSWVWGFGIPTVLMLSSIFVFFLGKNMYVYVKPEGSVFSDILRVFVASYKKRSLPLPGYPKQGVLYHPPASGLYDNRLPLTNQYSFLNKAAVIQEGEVNIDGTPTETSKWRLCSIQQIEEVKCLIRVLPIWASGIIAFTAAAQQSTFTVSQAMIMNRHIGPKFQIPPGSIAVISMLAVGIWLPIYDRIVVPALRKVTKHEEGITLLQRMGVGLVFSIVSMIIAGLVEQKRRHYANSEHKALSIMWLTPQLVMLGFAEAFNFIGQMEFYNKQFPEKLNSLATSLFFCTIAGANYLSTAVVSGVHVVTTRHGKPGWLNNDMNQGKLDLFYYLLAFMGVVNLIYFLICAKKYHYKGSAKLVVKDLCTDTELLHSRN